MCTLKLLFSFLSFFLFVLESSKKMPRYRNISSFICIIRTFSGWILLSMFLTPATPNLFWTSMLPLPLFPRSGFRVFVISQLLLFNLNLHFKPISWHLDFFRLFGVNDISLLFCVLVSDFCHSTISRYQDTLSLFHFEHFLFFRIIWLNLMNAVLFVIFQRATWCLYRVITFTRFSIVFLVFLKKILPFLLLAYFLRSLRN
mmetsp:Transcript_1184/g.1581  ORF Transcript_1184/g.1581 Transcript_1184/m.1581 type:complete len:201 (-) Transcript_1184:614-1216(-)